MSMRSELRVVTEGAIEQDPDLHATVLKANDYFDKKAGEHPNVWGTDRTLSWHLRADPIDGQRLAVGYNERDEYGSRHLTRWVTLPELCDPVARDVAVLRLPQLVVRQRPDQIDKAPVAHLRALDREGEDVQPD